ncbi:kinase-like domain-containing protein [Apiosordaria backusii]|uniref:Kinase-like domain-containing protein n=1 Tax=Apiosordaria backusii TaxID=314023 RepID=A0AA40ES96_9PEZI|nr:kinase-like domain-containing protein [Apiosordaria backusii]
MPLILNGPQGTAILVPVDESGLYLWDTENAQVPTVVEESRSQSQKQSEDVSALPGVPSLPLPPVITTEHPILLPKNLEILGLGGSGYIYKCPGGFAYKVHASQREVDFMKAAGDCSVTPFSRVMRNVHGVLVPCGLIMELATPFNFKLVPSEERATVKDEMINLVERLHSSKVGIVHGDIKPANFLRCRDGKLRLCDFDSARLIADEDTEGWEGFVSERYVAPSRGFPKYGPPTVRDDNYALAISIWELYTGNDALIDEDMEEVLNDGRTVDVDELEDQDIRNFVRKRLRDGGAKVEAPKFY